MHLTIKNEPYVVTPISHPDGPAYRVTAATSPTDRFHRVYAVKLGADGKPRSCSCPSYLHRGVPCKHMTALAEQLAAPEQAAEPVVETEAEKTKEKPTTEAHLVRGGYRKQFLVYADRVVVHTFYRSDRLATATYDNVQRARDLWVLLTATGWERF